MKLRLYLLSLFLFGTYFLDSQSINEYFDTSFGTNGVVTLKDSSTFYSGISVTIQEDKKILVAGYALKNSVRSILLVRLLEDGQFDTSFGENGVVVHSVSSEDDVAFAVGLQSDGKILIAGHSGIGGKRNFLLMRYLDSGQVDSLFGENGFVLTQLGSGNDAVSSMKVLEDDKIILCGSSNQGQFAKIALTKYHPNGMLDSSFGENGILISNIAQGNNVPRDLSLANNNKLLVTGFLAEGFFGNIFLARYNENGEIDTAFGINGFSVFNTPMWAGDSRSVVVGNENKVLLTGDFFNGSRYQTGVLRFNENGTLDTGFGNNGIVNILLGQGGQSRGNTIRLLSNKKIIVSGNNVNIGTISSFNNEGILDLDFGSDGIIPINLGTNRNVIHSMEIQSDDKIIVVGEAGSSQTPELFVIRLNTDNTTNVSQYLNKKNISIYPNPSSDIVFLSIPNLSGGLVQIQIIDSRGVMVRHQSLNAQGAIQSELNFQNLSSGIYFVKIFVDEEFLDMKKVIFMP